MSITYTWKITGLKTKTEGSNVNAVVQTYWTKTGTDENGNEGTFSGATPFTTLPEKEDSIFISFEELTEEIVLGWIKDVVVDGYEEHVNNQIQKQIDEKINAVSEPKLPWVIEEEEVVVVEVEPSANTEPEVTE